MATNQLVAGKITLYQATAYWQRTRAHAARTVHRFHQADDAYQAGQHSCRPPDIADDPDASLAAFTACQHNIAQRDDTLRAARAAIDTWHHHLMDMNELRGRTMAPARAIQRWNTYWKHGAAELHHYHKQRRQTDNQSC